MLQSCSGAQFYSELSRISTRSESVNVCLSRETLRPTFYSAHIFIAVPSAIKACKATTTDANQLQPNKPTKYSYSVDLKLTLTILSSVRVCVRERSANIRHNRGGEPSNDFVVIWMETVDFFFSPLSGWHVAAGSLHGMQEKPEQPKPNNSHSCVAKWVQEYYKALLPP